MPTGDDSARADRPRRRLYIQQEPGESDEVFIQRMCDFAKLTTLPEVLAEATGPPTFEWSSAQVEEWVEALKRTKPR